MIAFKGFTKDLTANCGRGIFQYRIGDTYENEHSKTASTGYHCAEYPLDCFKWYPPGADNRYCMVEAAGSIDETTGDSKIACTRMTLLKEISEYEMAYHSIKYMVEHPLREWKTSWSQGQQASGIKNNDVAIARGSKPIVSGKNGSILGLVTEPAPGIITAAKLLVVGKKGIRPDTEYMLDNKGKLVKV